VWSWTNGIENALNVYLDIDDIKAGKSMSMPEPIKKAIPQMWIDNGESFSESGTLIVWSKLDRVIWRKGKTIIDNSEKVIGRMYRKFLDENKVSIRMMAFDIESTDTSGILVDKEALPNDPMYLMEQTSCPEPFANKSMFRHFPSADSYEIPFTIKYKDDEHRLFIRLSFAKDEARAGAQPHGKHAQSNEGISVVRAGRELEMDKTYYSHVTKKMVGVGIPPFRRVWVFLMSQSAKLFKCITNGKGY
jgi:hypothetical protein